MSSYSPPPAAAVTTSSSTSQSSPPSSSSSSLTRLDRTIQVIIDRPDDTPSRCIGKIPPRIERLHRLHGTSLIFDVAVTTSSSSTLRSHEKMEEDNNNNSNDNKDDTCQKNDSTRTVQEYDGLSLGPSTVATACTIFHRFYHSVSLTEYDVWSVAMASTLLATKVEEEPKTLKQIIDIYARVYLRRLLLADFDSSCCDDGDGGGVTEDENNGRDGKGSNMLTRAVLESPYIAVLSHPTEKWPSSQKQHFCNNINLQQHLNKFGTVYKEWYRQISNVESIVLKQLGFTLYWIPNTHPHKFILYFCQVLDLKDNQKFTQRAWNYCNDSYRLDLCVRYPPEVIACSVMLLAARDYGIDLPTTPRVWWHVFIGETKENALALVTVANAILGLRCLSKVRNVGKGWNDAMNSNNDDEVTIDWLVASKGFVPSLVTKSPNNPSLDEGTDCSAVVGGFNDPGTFLWEYHRQLLLDDKGFESGEVQ